MTAGKGQGLVYGTEEQEGHTSLFKTWLCSLFRSRCLLLLRIICHGWRCMVSLHVTKSVVQGKEWQCHRMGIDMSSSFDTIGRTSTLNCFLNVVLMTMRSNQLDLSWQTLWSKLILMWNCQVSFWVSCVLFRCVAFLNVCLYTCTSWCPLWP